MLCILGVYEVSVHNIGYYYTCTFVRFLYHLKRGKQGEGGGSVTSDRPASVEMVGSVTVGREGWGASSLGSASRSGDGGVSHCGLGRGGELRHFGRIIIMRHYSKDCSSCVYK